MKLCMVLYNPKARLNPHPWHPPPPCALLYMSNTAPVPVPPSQVRSMLGAFFCSFINSAEEEKTEEKTRRGTDCNHLFFPERSSSLPPKSATSPTLRYVADHTLKYCYHSCYQSIFRFSKYFLSLDSYIFCQATCTFV